MKMYAKLVNLVTLALVFAPGLAFASEGAEAAGGMGKGVVAISAAIAIGLAALGGTLSQSKAISAGLEAIGRNPSASGKVFVPMILGLALIESLVILAFVIANKLAGNI